MPNRILKESICTSANVDALTADQERFFYRLLVACDDYGLMDARPPILRARCFPLKLDTLSDQDIADWLVALETADLLECYQVNGQPYLHMRRWARHQQIRNVRAKFPQPSEGTEISASNCKQMLADARTCPRNPIQSNPIQSNPNHVVTDVPTPLADSTPRKMFGTESEPYLLAVHLRARILANDPDARVPAETPDKLSSWSAEMDKLLRIDHRDAECIRRVIDWAEADQFWRANILSPPSLRKQFTRLHLAMQAKANGRYGGRETTIRSPSAAELDDRAAVAAENAAREAGHAEASF